jgi:hypothetical protein
MPALALLLLVPLQAQAAQQPPGSRDLHAVQTVHAALSAAASLRLLQTVVTVAPHPFSSYAVLPQWVSRHIGWKIVKSVWSYTHSKNGFPFHHVSAVQ